MEAKSFLKSRTVWVNAITLFIGVISAFRPDLTDSVISSVGLIIPEITNNRESINGITAIILAVINVWLRTQTIQPITVIEKNEKKSPKPKKLSTTKTKNR